MTKKIVLWICMEILKKKNALGSHYIPNWILLILNQKVLS